MTTPQGSNERGREKVLGSYRISRTQASVLLANWSCTGFCLGYCFGGGLGCLRFSCDGLGSSSLGGSRRSLALRHLFFVEIFDDSRHVRPRLVIRRHSPELFHPLRT